MNTLNTREIFRSLGLNAQENDLFHALLPGREMTVAELAKERSINRSTTYRYLNSLVEKGFAEWVVGRRGKVARAVTPEFLNSMIAERKHKLLELEATLPQLLAQLQVLRKGEKLKTAVRYYTDEQGYRQMIWNTLASKEFTRSYTVFRRREFVSLNFLRSYDLEWLKRGLQDKVIVNEKSVANFRLQEKSDHTPPGYIDTLQLRVIPSSRFDIANDIMIYNNIIYIASFLDNKEVVGVEIENAEVARTQKAIFDIVWEVAQPLQSSTLLADGS